MKQTISIGLLSALLAGFTLAPAPVSASGGWFWNCETESVTDFWEQVITGSELRGRGSVCSTPLGLWSTMSVHGLTPGNAYTVWWVYIDDPAACVDFPLPVTPPGEEAQPGEIPIPEPVDYAGRCGLADFFTPDPSGDFLNPLVVYGRMDGLIAGNHRRTRFTGNLRSFVPSPSSQVWMLIFGHGPADKMDKRQLARQLLTPEDPLSGVPHLGISGRPFGYPAGVVVVKMP